MSRVEPIAVTASAPVKAIALMVAGAAFLTANDAVIKWLAGGYPIGEIMFFRGLFVLPALMLLSWRVGGAFSLRVTNWRGQIMRAGLAIAGSFLFFLALKNMPLADAVAVEFAGPLILTALAAPLLAERVGWRRWLAVAVGFAGVLVMLRPGGDALRWVVVLPLGAAFLGALKDILTRRLAATETSAAMLAITTLGVTLAGLATLPFGWRWPDAGSMALFVGTGVLHGIAGYLLTETFRHAEAATVSPFRYTAMVWAVLLGLIIWGDVPDAWMITGAAIIAASGIYVLHRETRA